MGPLEHDEEDRLAVEAQIGRPLRGDWAVARRCHLGVPMVIESHPVLEDGSPFPTLFWLTCPILVKRASKLEATGRMGELNATLATSESLRNRIREAADRYKERRDGHSPIVSKSSPGGVDRIKCLHAHLGHELADPPNPVGALTLAQVGWPDCRVRCVEPDS
jgi:hypothetical protein